MAVSAAMSGINIQILYLTIVISHIKNTPFQFYTDTVNTNMSDKFINVLT